MSRDPIAEKGGNNIYIMLNNDPINYVDIYGLKRYSLRYDMAPSASVGNRAKATSSFSEIQADVIAKIDGKYSPTGEGNCNCIENIKIGGHGAPGLFYGEGNMSSSNSLSNNDFWSYHRLQKNNKGDIADSVFPNVAFISELSQYMCTGGNIEIIACETCKGEEGKDFKEYMEGYFGEGNFTGYENKVKWGPFGVTEVKDKGKKK